MRAPLPASARPDLVGLLGTVLLSSALGLRSPISLERAALPAALWDSEDRNSHHLEPSGALLVQNLLTHRLTEPHSSWGLVHTRPVQKVDVETLVLRAHWPAWDGRAGAGGRVWPGLR